MTTTAEHTSDDLVTRLRSPWHHPDCRAAADEIYRLTVALREAQAAHACAVEIAANYGVELREAQADAERYRHLRDDETWDAFDNVWLHRHDLYGQLPADMDKAIDAASTPAAGSPSKGGGDER